MNQIKKMVATAAGAAVLTAIGLAAPAAARADTNVQADNSCTNCNAQSGNSYSSNQSSSFTGQASGPGGANFQAGDNSTSNNQNASSNSGDANGGQVIGVADGHGNVNIVSRNRGQNINVGTGNTHANNGSITFTGQVGGFNVQFGDNTTRNNQTASSNSGDAVAGQIIGIV